MVCWILYSYAYYRKTATSSNARHDLAGINNIHCNVIMAQKQTIRFRIKQDGTVEEVVSDVCGSSCEVLTKRIEEKLGIISYREVTSDYYKNEEVVKTEQPLTKWR